ncbi:MAG: hypothetical protein DRN95_09210 [Candidatus Hydrothermarchaeota archaeon]|nr:MAG: hypothetical protein DRN95_09210 [Candidatus Hydrothermarchaeota archaeon]
MRDETLLCSIAIICITILEIMAMLCGIDGQLFLSTLAALSGVIGYFFGKKRGEENILKQNSY